MNQLQPTVKHGGFSVMVWGIIWHDRKSKLVVCDGYINSAKHIEILKEGLLPIFASAHVDENYYLFIEDGAPCHSSKMTCLASRKWHTETLVAKSDDTRYELN